MLPGIRGWEYLILTKQKFLQVTYIYEKELAAYGGAYHSSDSFSKATVTHLADERPREIQ